mgnify:CR=1 FL=1
MIRATSIPAIGAISLAVSLGSALACADEWQTAGNLNVPREYPGLGLLPDGRVLAVSGHPLGGQSLASAEVYDAETDKWTPTGSLNVPRNGVGHGSLIRLPSGKFLIAGGGSGSRSVHEVELYDPVQGTWSMTGAMSVPRCVHTTTQLDDGSVLVTGGIDWITEEVRATAEVYDATTGEWATTGAMNTPRFNHRAVKLHDGRVMAIGGNSAYPGEQFVVADAELYDPRSGNWKPTAPMHTPRRSLAAVVLADGRVLVAGGAGRLGEAKKQLSVSEVYDPQSEQWTEVAPLREGRWGPTATLLADGQVLIVGGAYGSFGSRSSAELFDPQDCTWRDAGKLSQARNGHRAITLSDGRVLIVGGHCLGRYLTSCEIYTP